MTNQFLKHIIELGNIVFPATVQNQAADVLLDYLGVATGGSSAIRGITQRMFYKHNVILRPCCCFEPRRASVEL